MLVPRVLLIRTMTMGGTLARHVLRRVVFTDYTPAGHGTMQPFGLPSFAAETRVAIGEALVAHEVGRRLGVSGVRVPGSAAPQGHGPDHSHNGDHDESCEDAGSR